MKVNVAFVLLDVADNLSSGLGTPECAYTGFQKILLVIYACGREFPCSLLFDIVHQLSQREKDLM